MIYALYAVAFGAGAAIALQASINGQLASGIGGNTVAAALFSFVTGTIALAVIAMSRGGLSSAIAELPSQPWWRLTGGLLGAMAIFSTVLLAPRIGLVNLLTLVIAGQLTLSLAIDHFGLLSAVVRPVSGVRLAGAIVMMAGVLMALFGDRLIALTKLTA